MTKKEERFLKLVKNMGRHYRREKIKAIAFYYGKANQHRIIAEECAELAKEALKGIRNNYSNKAELSEEIADVFIMINQAIELNRLESGAIMYMVDQKLDRQIERIKAEIEAKNKELKK